MYLIIFVILIITSKLFAINVAEEELTKTKPIEFNSYKGNYSKIDSLKMVKSIGIILASEIGDKNKNNYYNKYKVIRSISQNTSKFAADIIILTKKAKVKTINYLRQIILSYLIKAYGYNKQEALSLSKYITYYNAFYRDNPDYIKSNYQKEVLDNLDQNNIGLSLNYKDWPGKSYIIIPIILSVKETDISSNTNLENKDNKINIKNAKVKVDPFQLANKTVRENIKTNAQTIKDQKNLLKLKENSLEKSKEILKEKENQKNKIKKEIANLKDQQENQNIIQKNENTLKKINKEIKKEKSQIKEKEEKLKEEKKEIIKKEITNRIKKDKNEINKIKKELEDKAVKLDKREDNLRDKNLDKNIFDSFLYYLKTKQFISNGHYNNEMLILNPATGEVLVKSPIDNICGRKYDISSKGIIVIANAGSHDSKHYLALLDKNNLKPIKIGEDHIFGRSFVEIKEDFIYATYIKNSNHYLGKFDLDLKLIAQSEIQIANDNFISIFENFVYINDKTNNIAVLNKDNLKRVKYIKP